MSKGKTDSVQQSTRTMRETVVPGTQSRNSYWILALFNFIERGGFVFRVLLIVCVI